MGIRRAVVSAALAGVALCGCSLLIETSGFSGGAVPDAAAPTAIDGSGPSPEAAAPDASTSPDGTVRSLPCPKDAIFCDDFESGNVAKWGETDLLRSGAIAVISPAASDAPQAFAGKSIFHAHGDINAPEDGGVKSSTATISALFPPMSSGLFAVRAYLYVPAALANATSVIKLRHKDPTANPEDMIIKASSPGGTWYANTDNSVALDSNHYASVPIVIGKWFCLEWNVTIGSKGHHSVFVDGAQIISADEDTVGTTKAGYDELQLGLISTTGTKVQDVYFDDVAIATHPIGCE